jgi:D-glycero-alpha-D-manno-heptose-7-phosphate kinase
MYAYLGKYRDPESLAQEACEIEIDILKKPIGIQDQYIAAYGGLRSIEFSGATSGDSSVGDRVLTEVLQMDPTIMRRLNQNLMLFYTNLSRKAESVLAEQKENIEEKRATLRSMHNMAVEGKSMLEGGCIDDFGELLDVAWQMKKRLASKISNPFIDDLYERAKQAGARGGKIAGAGGGGFLLLYCNRDKQERVREVMQELPELPFHLERDGSKVIFNYRR